MKKILPVELNTKIETECWTYWKMAIIQTLPDYRNWLSSHMDVYFWPSDEKVYFGNEHRPHQHEYFSDILDIEELYIFSVPSDEIISFIKSQINNKYYYTVFIRNENNYFHEVFIYGYDDDEERFKSFALNDNGHFISNDVTYEQLKIGYKEILDFYKLHPDMYYKYRDFSYMMSRTKPISRYITKNYASEYFFKISHETYGARVDLNYSNSYGVYLAPHHFYTGVSCLFGIKDMIIDVLNLSVEDTNENKYHYYNLKNSMFKLLEHKIMIIDAMEWHEEKWNISDDKIINLRVKYSAYCEKMREMCMMFLKFTQTFDKNLLQRILDRLSDQYTNEKVALGQYIELIREWYFSKILSSCLNEAN